MHARRRSLRFAAALLLAAALAGAAFVSVAASRTGGAAGSIKIGYVPKLTGIKVFDVAEGCLNQVAKSEGASVTYSAPATADAQGQVNIFNSLIARHYNVLITSADDPALLAPTLERAMRQGIKVISFDSDVLPQARNLYLGNAPAGAIAKAQVDELVQGLGGGHPKADIAILSSTPTATVQLEWIKLMKAYIKAKYPGLHIVTTQYGYSDLQKSLTAATNLLHAYPSVKGIIAPDALAVPGAAQAVDKLGLKGKVVVTGLTDPLSIAPYMENGTVQKVFLWDYCQIGKELGYLSKLAVEGKLPSKYPATIPLPAGLGTLKVDKQGNAPCCKPLTITKANVKKFNW